MNQSDDQNNSGLRVSGYGPRIKQTLIVVIVLAIIVAAIVLAAIWANNREPDPGVQPTPRSTQAPQPTATSPPPDTPTTEPTEATEVQVADTPTTSPTEAPPEDTRTPDVETPETRYADTYGRCHGNSSDRDSQNRKPADARTDGAADGRADQYSGSTD